MADIDTQLIQQVAVSAGAVAATATVHAFLIVVISVFCRRALATAAGPGRVLRDLLVLVVLSLWLLAAHAVEIWMWAHVFLRVGAFEMLEPALYFSAACFTTLGFGDVLLPDAWRLLSGACAANGLLLFGMSAAYLFDITARLRLHD